MTAMSSSAMTDVTMPRLSDSMEEGTILKWLPAAGDEVGRGDELVEIETDKATMTYEAEASGVLEIVAEVGETVPLGAVIARIGVPGAAPRRDDGQDQGGSSSDDRVNGRERAAAATPVAAPAPASGAAADGSAKSRAFASPLARRIAAELGVDLTGMTGTGPRGRIVRTDVEAAAARSGSPTEAAARSIAPAVPAAPFAAPAAANGTAKGEITRIEPTKIQQVGARRMAESKATAPDFTLQVDVDMARAVELRRQIKDVLEGEPAPTINDMVVKACALALRKHPKANGSYRDGAFELYSRINVGVALATDHGLLVPTVFDADAKSLGEIARTVRGFAARGREGAITPPELGGGTFSVSNLGMYGMRSFTAVLNPPQAAILAVGALAERPWVDAGQLVVRSTMALSLTVDHRILNGAEAAEFLTTIVQFLQAPGRLAFS
ncbi:MAG: 2-oxo acid dehydrogenase subunit [Solirubrobacterales bacterium]|nr:2-oxo acid dehydrogenase subunit [Solirubrobacterales bacterium]